MEQSRRRQNAAASAPRWGRAEHQLRWRGGDGVPSSVSRARCPSLSRASRENLQHAFAACLPRPLRGRRVFLAIARSFCKPATAVMQPAPQDAAPRTPRGPRRPCSRAPRLPQRPHIGAPGGPSAAHISWPASRRGRPASTPAARRRSRRLRSRAADCHGNPSRRRARSSRGRRRPARRSERWRR